MVAAMTPKDQSKTPLSPVFAHGEAARPRVRQPQSPLTLWAGFAGAGVLGLLVFNGLSSSREARAQTTMVPAPAAAAQPAQPAPPVAPPAQIVPTPAPMTQSSVVRTVDPSEAHWRSPAMVVDFSTPADAAQTQIAQATGAAAASAVPGPSADTRQSADERFSARLSGGSSDTARASQMRDLGRTVPQGAIIAAVLETAINSDLPGSVRAVVSRDVRSFDGSRVLVPRGSKLIGQYKSAAAVGQTRAFVIWTRIITPSGVSIDVGSPATDRLGRGGLEGDVDRHFFQRFGSSILLSVISAGTTALANGGGSDTTLVIGSTSQANQVASIALQKQIDIPDTIKVAQGMPVQVSVARDLDFSSVVR